MAKLGNFVEPNVTAISLESHLERIALEAGFLSNMAETVKSLLPDFKFKLKELVSKISGLSEENKDISETLTRRQRKAVEVIKKLDFLVYGARIISVPENFEGSFLKYSEELSKICDDVTRECSGFIGEYDLILSSFITNKDDKNVIVRHEALFKKIKSARDEITKRLSHYFPKSNGRSKLKLSEVMSRFNDFPELFENTNSLTTKQKMIGLDQIQTSVNHCVELLDIIIQNVQSGATKEVTPEALQNISIGAYEVGKYVEVLSIFYFDTMVFLKCVNDMLADFEKI